MSTTIEKFVSGNVNPPKFLEELENALPGVIVDVTFAGFETTNRRLMTRLAVAKEIGRRKDSTGTTIDIGDPGALRFTTALALDTGQEAAIDTLVAAHDSLLLTTEQLREDKDDTVILTVANNLRRAAWDGLTNAQKSETLRRACQLLFRNRVERNFDTDD